MRLSWVGRASLPLTNTNTVSSEESEAFTRVICQAHEIGFGLSVSAGLLQPGQPFEMLQLYDPGQPGSRTVLRGDWCVSPFPYPIQLKKPNVDNRNGIL